MATKLFRLGLIVATPAALALMTDAEIDGNQLLERHQCGDWGDMSPDDWAANYRALDAGERILSAYGMPPLRLWIITEADRSATTILLPSEY